MRENGGFQTSLRGIFIAALAILLLAGAGAGAQEMPPPHKSPRVPVNRQALPDGEKAALKSRDITGPVEIVDGEHLRMGNIDLRLFGVVPPQLSASFGPQARMALDELTRGQNVNCQVRDRDRDGHFLATCATVGAKADLALELLKRGLAVTARGSLQPTDLAAPYEAAEQAAQAQKLGLWSVTAPAASMPAVPKTENANIPPLASELKREEKPAALPAKPVVIMAPVASAAASTPPANLADQVEKAMPPGALVPLEDESGPGFFARYQLLIAGFLMLMTALGIVIALLAERRRDRRDEMKAVAAALRGELLAARAVCQARLKSWTDADEKSAAWPRIRATLYQAYVGRLGWLGAVLARQVASIYGQASDYAAYFNPNAIVEPRPEAVSKRQALQLLIQHIEEVLPKLAFIEQTGMRPGSGPMPKPAVHAPAEAFTAAHESGSGGANPMPHVAAVVQAAAPLWQVMKKFASRRHHETRPAAEEPLSDYTALIEEEMARMSEEETAPPPSNVTKMRGTGG